MRDNIFHSPEKFDLTTVGTIQKARDIGNFTIDFAA